MQSLFVIDVTRGYLPATLLTAAAYAREGGEALLVRGTTEHKLVTEAVERFRPTRVYSMAGATPPLKLGRGGDDRIPVETLPAESAPLMAWMMAHVVDHARGVVLFPAHSPSWAVKAAALATRLGYLVWPLEEAAGFAHAAPAEIPVVAVGEAPASLRDLLQGREFRHLPGDRAVAQYLKERGLPVSYVVLINTADLETPAYTSPSMGASWTQGLSLLAPMLASYRQAWVIDARTPRPDPKEIERTLIQKVADAGLTPEYLAVLASPGAIPYLSETNPSPTGTEDLVRDVHLRLNTDIFFDVAEGRLFGQSAGKVSLQILNTKHHSSLQGAFRSRALIMGRPHVEAGITYAIDEAVGRTQVRPLLEQAGLTVSELYGNDCSPGKAAAHLPNAGLVLYGGHGSPDALSTHEMPLYAEALPARVAPGVVYACACSTMYPLPTRRTSDGGFSHEEEITPFAEQIGPAFVDRGALAFVGGLTAEDVLLNTPMYVVFMQALTLKGMSVGHAVRAARNHSLAHLALISQAAPASYAAYRSSLAGAVQQQALMGDPAFAPYKATTAARLPREVRSEEESLLITVRVPEKAWSRLSLPVDAGRPNREFHRARHLESWIPAGEDLYNWGESYTVAPDADEVSQNGLLGAYLHLTADLPAGRVPVSLRLEGVEAFDGECLLCGTAHPGDDLTARFRKYAVPFMGSQPPIQFDHSEGWSFVTEERSEGLRAHWMLPVTAIADRERRAYRLKSATFRLDHRAGVRVEGRLELEQGALSAASPAAMEGTRGQLPEELLLSFGHLTVRPQQEPVTPGAKPPAPRLVALAQTVSGPGGRWTCWLPEGQELALRVDLPMPVHRYLFGVIPTFEAEPVTGIATGRGPIAVSLKAAGAGRLRGLVVDGTTGRPLTGARLAIWRGRPGSKGPITETFVLHGKTDAQGRFEYSLPPGGYVIQSAHRTDLRYQPGKGAATLFRERESTVLIPMEPAAAVSGQVRYEGAYQPRSASVRLYEYGGKPEEVVGAGRVRRDGSFELMAPVTRPFVVQVTCEGFEPMVDTNDGTGYHLAPGEQLERSYTLKGEQ